MHLCAACNIRAMPETEIPPPFSRGDNYMLNIEMDLSTFGLPNKIVV